MRIFSALVGFGSLLLMALAGPAAAQSYSYLATIGAGNAVTGLGSGQFNQPFDVAADTVNGHIFVSDSVNNRIQVFSSATFAYVATIGPNDGSTGVDNGHFDLPGGVGVDTAHGHLFVADAKNNRVQVFSTSNFAYVTTIGADSGAAGTDNAHFNLPISVAIDQANGQILVVDTGNHRIQVFNATNFGYLASIGVGRAHSINSQDPLAVAVDGPRGHIILLDYLLNCGEVLATGSYQSIGTIGQCLVDGGLGNDQFNKPFGVTVDTTNGRILIADTVNNRVQVFDATSYAYLETIGSDLGLAGFDNASLYQPNGVGFDASTGHVLVADTLGDRVQVFTPGADSSAKIFAAVLPGSRTVRIGTAATVFAAIVNGSGETLNDCGVALPSSAPAGLSMNYQTANAQNQLIGTPNTPASIVSQGAQSYVLSFQSSQALAVKALPLVFSCSGAPAAPVVPDVDTVDLTFATSPGADVIALAATATNNGIVSMPEGGANAFAIATANLGSAETLTVSVDFGGVSYPVNAGICQTNSSSACLATPQASFQHSFAAGETSTFSVFVGSTGTIPFDPTNHRVYVRFTDSAGAPHGQTSVAVETQ